MTCQPGRMFVLGVTSASLGTLQPDEHLQPEKRKVGSSTLPLTTDYLASELGRRAAAHAVSVPLTDRDIPPVTLIRRLLSHADRTLSRHGWVRIRPCRRSRPDDQARASASDLDGRCVSDHPEPERSRAQAHRSLWSAPRLFVSV